MQKHWLVGPECGQKSLIYPQMLTKCLTMGGRRSQIIFDFRFDHLNLPHPTSIYCLPFQDWNSWRTLGKNFDF